MRDCKCCDGVSLDKGPQEFLGGLIKTQEASYIDLRNYLFSRQCNLLLKLNRPSPWEVAQRTLDFLHNLIHELSMDTLKVCTVVFKMLLHVYLFFISWYVFVVTGENFRNLTVNFYWPFYHSSFIAIRLFRFSYLLTWAIGNLSTALEKCLKRIKTSKVSHFESKSKY